MQGGPQRHYAFFGFFAGIVLLAAVYPLFLGSLAGIILLHALISVVLVTGVYVVGRDRKTSIVGGIIGTTALVLTWTSLAVHQAQILRVCWLCSMAVFYAYIIAGMFRGFLAAKQVTLVTVFGGISGFLLLANFWAILFQIIETVHPGSYDVPGDPRPTTDVFIYFAHVTISSVGYGDITPVTPLARSCAAMLGICGQLYLAVFISALIGIYLNETRPRPPGASRAEDASQVDEAASQPHHQEEVEDHDEYPDDS